MAIMAKSWKDNIKFCPGEENADEKGNWNNYRTSNVREELLLNMIPALGRENLLLHEVDLVADNGDRSYGTVEGRVFLITCDEYRKYRDYIPRYDRWIWSATPWYCGDKDSDTGRARYVRGAETDGWFGGNAAFHNGAVVPACILNPAFLNLRQSMAYVEERKEKENAHN